MGAIEAAGYQATPDIGAATRAARRVEWRAAVWRLFVAAFCAMQIILFAAPAYFSAPGDLAADHKRLLDWSGWLLTLPVLCSAAQPLFAGAWRSVVQRHIGMDVPVALGIAVAFLASSGAAFEPGGAFGSVVYFNSLAMFVSFLLGGRLLELRARHRAEAAFDDATGQLPQTVVRQLPDGGVEEVGQHRTPPSAKRGGGGCPSAKPTNPEGHRIGVQRLRLPVAEPRDAEIKSRPGELQRRVRATAERAVAFRARRPVRRPRYSRIQPDRCDADRGRSARWRGTGTLCGRSRR